jgi:uncharacterized protein (TIGR02453 family)
MPTTQAPTFTPATFKFLKALARNNSKEWFAAHKAEYEAEVKARCLHFIGDLAEPLKKISPQLVANPKPIGGSLFRIYRDTRFSGDKSPYKTHSGMSFYHAATKATARAEGQNAMMGRLDAPGFYLHLEPGASFIGGGLWHPQPETMKRVRAYMLNNPASWKKATQNAAFIKTFGGLGGDSLQRPPAGFDPQHELITDLKRKDYICGAALTDAEVCSPELLKIALAHYRTAAPLLDWLCGALDLEF